MILESRLSNLAVDDERWTQRVSSADKPGLHVARTCADRTAAPLGARACKAPREGRQRVKAGRLLEAADIVKA